VKVTVSAEGTRPAVTVAAEESLDRMTLEEAKIALYWAYETARVTHFREIDKTFAARDAAVGEVEAVR
jgi:hypothetical protein